MPFLRLISRAIRASAVVGRLPSPASAQAGPPPGFPPAALVAALVTQRSEFAAVRARWEGKPDAEVTAAGYRIDQVCVRASGSGAPAAFGTMNRGFRAVHPQRLAAQFPENRWDPQAPPVLLLDTSKRVVGLEWEGRNTGQPPVLFGQTAPLLPGHPGLSEVTVPHYMLHAYFRPGGMVLFDVFDPELRCPVPVAAPAQLPRTGGGSPLLVLLAGVGLLGASAALRWHRGGPGRRGAASVAGAAPASVEAAMPPPLVLRVVNPLIRAVLRSPLHRALANKVMLLSVHGRRTGRTHVVPVGRHECEGAFLVSASGSWRHNLRAGAPVRLVLDGTDRAGYVEEVERDSGRVAEIFARLLERVGRGRAGELGLRINVERSVSAAEIEPAVAGRWIARVRLADDAEQGGSSWAPVQGRLAERRTALFRPRRGASRSPRQNRNEED